MADDGATGERERRDFGTRTKNFTGSLCSISATSDDIDHTGGQFGFFANLLRILSISNLQGVSFFMILGILSKREFSAP